MKFSRLFLCLSCAVLSTQHLWAQDDSSTDTSTTAVTTTTAYSRAVLSQKIDDLEARIQSLEQQQAANQAAASQAAAAQQSADELSPNGETNNENPYLVNPAGNGNGQISEHGVEDYTEDASEYLSDTPRYVEFNSASKNVQFKIGGYVLSDLDLFAQPNTQYLDGNAGKAIGNAPIPQGDFNTFKMRKFHLAFKSLYDNLAGVAINIESTKSTGVLLNISSAYAFLQLNKQLELDMGRYGTVMTLEGVLPGIEEPVEEASMVACLAPNHDVGVMLSGGNVLKLFDYSLELSNGVQDNLSTSTDTGEDTTNYLDYWTGRIFFIPFEKDKEDTFLKNFGFGVAGSIDYDPNDSPWTKIQTSLGGNDIAIYGGSVKTAGDFFHFNPQFYFYNGSFGMYGDYIQSTETVREGSADPIQLDNQAWHVEASYVVGGKATPNKGAIADNPFDMSKGQWGALELGLRLQQLFIDPNSFVTGTAYAPAAMADGAQRAIAYGVACNWILDPHMKFLFNLEQTDFTGGNQSVKSELVFISRMQAMF